MKVVKASKTRRDSSKKKTATTTASPSSRKTSKSKNSTKGGDAKKKRPGSATSAAAVADKANMRLNRKEIALLKSLEAEFGLRSRVLGDSRFVKSIEGCHDDAIPRSARREEVKNEEGQEGETAPIESQEDTKKAEMRNKFAEYMKKREVEFNKRRSDGLPSSRSSQSITVHMN